MAVSMHNVHSNRIPEWAGLIIAMCPSQRDTLCGYQYNENTINARKTKGLRLEELQRKTKAVKEAHS